MYLASAKHCEPATPLLGYRENCWAKTNMNLSITETANHVFMQGRINIQLGLYSMNKKQDFLNERPLDRRYEMVYSNVLN